MNTIRLIITCKYKQKQNDLRLKNHTRLFIFVLCLVTVSFLIVSCSKNREKYGFSNSSSALDDYNLFLNEMQQKKSLDLRELIHSINAWQELADTVYNYINTDPSFEAHTWLSSTFYSIHDSIRSQFYRLALDEKKTLNDILHLKYGTCIHRDDEEFIVNVQRARALISSLDTIPVYNYNKDELLGRYRSFLMNMERNGISNLDTLCHFIQEEDIFFRTFLLHLDEYADERLDDITKMTSNICRSVFKSASQNKIDAGFTMILMSMRTNRRLIQNAISCLDSIEKGVNLKVKQMNAYNWMMIQPFIAIDSIGMAVLTPEEIQQLDKIAKKIHQLDRKHIQGNDSTQLCELCSLILKLYISTL